MVRSGNLGFRSFVLWLKFGNFNLPFVKINLMISEKIASLLNEQITKEQYAAQYYLSMSAWFHARDLEGIANYFRVQSKEESMHADKIFDYLLDVGREVELGQIEKPPHEFQNEEEVFEKALAHEKIVTKSIFDIVKQATEEGDFATTSFLQWFVNEQVEEEDSASLLVSKVRRVKDNASALYLFDQELGQRTFVGEAE